MTAWNFAIVVDAIAHAVPGQGAAAYGERRISWRELASRSRSLAWSLATQMGVHADDRVALVLANRPEYLETFIAARKLRAKPLGIPVGLGANELHAAIDGSDARLVLCEPATADAVRAATRRIQKRWRPAVLETGPTYEEMIAETIPPTDWDLEIPTADDLIAIADLDASAHDTPAGPTVLSVAPFAEGDSFGAALGALVKKGRLVFLDPPPFEAPRVWDAVQREQVTKLVIAGDAQARRLLGALDAFDAAALGSLATIHSTGAPLSADVAAAITAAIPGVTVTGVVDAPAAPSAAATPMVLPSDIERRLCKHASVTDCVVLGLSDPRIGKLVIAVVQVADSHYLDEPELAAWCRAHLPASMTPARFVLVDHVERSASGDVDEPALRKLAIDRLLEGR